MYRYGHWVSEHEVDENLYFGFIYLIVNKVNGKKYIGKKQFYQYRGRKKWKRFDWESYTSSSKDLNFDIKTVGKESFDFKIIHLCKTRGDLTYLESNEQHKQDVLVKRLPNGDREFYNKAIAGIKFIPPLSHTQDTKDKIAKSSKKQPKNTSGISLEAKTDSGRSRRSKIMSELNRVGKNHIPKPRPHLVKFKDGTEFVVEDWVAWAAQEGYSKNTLELVRRGRSKSARKNRKPSDKDVVYIQPYLEG